MKLLEERIRRDGIVREGGVLKVDSFLNHQMDIQLFIEMGKEFARLYEGCGADLFFLSSRQGVDLSKCYRLIVLRL